MALKAYEKAISTDPKDQQAYVALIDLHRQRGDDVKALITYKRSLGNGIKSVAVLERLFWIMGQNGFEELGRKMVEEAFQINRDTANYYFMLSGLEWSLSNNKKAIEYASKALLIDSVNSSYIVRLAICYMFDRQYDQY